MESYLEKKSFVIMSKEKWIFLIIILLAGGLSRLYMLNVKNNISHKMEESFKSESGKRKILLLNALMDKKSVLESIDSFFQASNFVSLEEFKLFADKFRVNFDLISVCWHSSDRKQEYVVSKEKLNNSRCKSFNFIEPSKILDDSIPKIMLSKFSSSRNNQKGYVTIVFSLQTLFPKEKSTVLNEYLLLMDSVKNTLRHYSFSEGKFIFDKDLFLKDNPKYQIYEIETINDVSFIYLFAFDGYGNYKSEENEALFISLLIFFLITVLGLYMQSILFQKKKIDKIVVRKTEELEQFAYRTSHDLKGPLSTIKVLAHYVATDMKSGEFAEAGINITRISKQAQKLEALVTDILDLAKSDIEDEKVEKIDFSIMVEEIKERHSQKIIEKDIEIEYKDRLEKPLVSNRPRINQILENLISNSIKYSDQEKKVRKVEVQTLNVGNSIHILVKDNGLGIPLDKQSEVFKMFKRFHPDTAEGSGLGLSIIKKHVDRLDGQIYFTSSDEGSIFELILPKS